MLCFKFSHQYVKWIARHEGKVRVGCKQNWLLGRIHLVNSINWPLLLYKMNEILLKKKEIKSHLMNGITILNSVGGNDDDFWLYTVRCLFMLTNMRMPIPSNKAWNKITIRCTKHDIREVRHLIWMISLKLDARLG